MKLGFADIRYKPDKIPWVYLAHRKENSWLVISLSKQRISPAWYHEWFWGNQLLDADDTTLYGTLFVRYGRGNFLTAVKPVLLTLLNLTAAQYSRIVTGIEHEGTLILLQIDLPYRLVYESGMVVGGVCFAMLWILQVWRYKSVYGTCTVHLGHIPRIRSRSCARILFCGFLHRESTYKASGWPNECPAVDNVTLPVNRL